VTETTLSRTWAVPAAPAAPAARATPVRGLGSALSRAAGRSQPLLLTAQGLWDLADLGEPQPDLAAWGLSRAGQACTVWLGADLLVDLLAVEEAALRDAAARSEWARRVLQHYHGDDALRWPLWPWRLRGAAGASALQGVSLPALQAQAEGQGVKLRTVSALWPQLLVHALAVAPRKQPRQTCWLVEAPLTPRTGAAPVLTQVVLTEGRITGLQRRRLQQPVGSSLRQLLEEAGPGGTHTLLWWGAAPEIDAAWPPALQPARVLPAGGQALSLDPGSAGDFMNPVPRAGALAWAWLATCAAVLTVAGLEAHAAWQARDEARAHSAAVALTAPVAAGTARADATAPRQAATPAEREAQSLRELQARRSHPWGAVFAATELPAVAGLRWLSMEHGTSGELRLQGLAPEPGAVQRAADTLRAQAPWQQVLVARLEAQDEPAAASPAAPAARNNVPAASLLSFEIQARLRPPLP
jgi:hypothetical protein